MFTTTRQPSESMDWHRVRGRVTTWLVLAICGVVWQPTSQAMTRGLVMDASWSFRKAQRLCVLEQVQPGTGTARFTSEAGLPIRFEFVPQSDPFAAGPVQARAEAPEWHPAWPSAEERGALAHIRGGVISATEPVALQLLMDLERGRIIRLTGLAPGGAGEAHARVVLPQRLEQARTAFVACRHVLMPADFADVELTSIGFAAGQARLSAADRARLDLVARYILADRMMSGVVIDGHSDRRGSEEANLRMSRSRAGQVARYLAARGIPRRLLTVRHHGAQFPINEGEGVVADGRNRRVTVQLRRADDVQAADPPAGSWASR